MDALINEMYKDAMIVDDLRGMLYEAALNNGEVITVKWRNASERLRGFTERIAVKSPETAKEILEGWEYTGKGEADFRVLAAKTEQLLIPTIVHALGVMYDEIRTHAAGWRLEKTPIGFFTICNNNTGRYLHSPYDPMWEATILARGLYREDMDSFHILGCGLGYLPYQIWLQSDRAAKICLYEEDEVIVQLARSMGVLEWIDPEYLTVVEAAGTEELLSLFLQNIEEGNANYFISDWKSEAYPDTGYGKAIAEIDFNDRTERINKIHWSANIRENRKRTLYDVAQLQADYGLEADKCIVVSAGPSLNDNISYIKDNSKSGIVIAVNTSIRRLAKEGIRPDVIVMLDPLPELKDHLDGIENFTQEIPLVMPITGSRAYASAYRGPIYIIPEKDKAWKYGGTVASLALELAFHLGAKRVDLIGSDLAYSGGANYAEGVAHEKKEGIVEENIDKNVIVSTDGGTVSTNGLYNYYRGILEEQILSHPEVMVINRAEHGALIRGTYTPEESGEDEAITELAVLEENEAAYQRRYGVSLKDLLAQEGLKKPEKYDVLFKTSRDLMDRMGKTPDHVRFLVCVGFAEGSCLKKLLQEAPNVDRLLVYEPDRAAFLYACCTKNLADILEDERVEVVLGNPDKELNDLLKEPVERATGLLNVYHMYGRVTPGYGDIYAGVLEKVIDAVKSILLLTTANYNTAIYNSKEMFCNQLYAFSKLSVNGLASNLFKRIETKEVPVIIVGAGPSLQKNAKDLARFKGKALIVACTRATETLEKYGIAPDLVAMVDYANGHDYCLHDQQRNYRVLFYAQSAADIQEAYLGQGIYFGFDSDLFSVSELEDNANFETGGSVITTIFALFVQSGFQNIVLVGEDLAYGENGKTHSGTYAEAETGMEDYLVDGIYGDKVYARSDWEAFRRFLEMEIEAHKEIHVADATEGGALIHGTEVIALREYADRLTTVYPIEEWLSAEESRSGITEDRIRKVLNGFEEKCKDFQVLLSDALAYNEVLASPGAQKDDAYYKEILDKYNQCYKVVVENGESDLLKAYCEDIFFGYADQAQYKRCIGNMREILRVESEFFTKLRIAVSELKSYITEITLAL